MLYFCRSQTGDTMLITLEILMLLYLKITNHR